MQFKTLVETTDGEVEFTANLNTDEVQFLLEFAVNTLMQQGALPFVQIKQPHDFNMQSAETQ